MEKIKNLLNLRNPVIYRQSPDRKNKKMYVKKLSKVGSDTMDWFIEELMEKQETMPKTIIYCRRYKDCSDIYRGFAAAFGPNS